MKQILWLSVICAVGCYIACPLEDPDLWWHIVIGRWIVSHKSVPLVDYWTMFGSGQAWRAYSWSNEVVYALVDKYFSLKGLAVAQIALAVILAGTFAISSGRIAANYFLGLLIGCVTVAATTEHFALRPQSLSWGLLALAIMLADQIDRGVGKFAKLGLGLTFVVWANTHLSSIFGLIAVASWVCPQFPLKSGDLRKVISMLAVAFGGTLVTPYLGGEWATLVATSGHPFEFRGIIEFEPATITQLAPVIVILLWAIILTLAVGNFKQIRPSRLIAAGIFSFAGLAVLKFMPVAVVYLSAFLASLVRTTPVEGSSPGQKLLEGLGRLQQALGKFPREGLAFVFIALAIVNIVRVVDQPINKQNVPVAAVDFMQKNRLSGPYLNMFGQGGYLNYRYADDKGIPGNLVSIDGRTNLIPADLWQDYEATSNGTRGWAAFLDRVKPETILWRSSSPLTQILIASKEWCAVYRGVGLRGASILIKSERARQFSEFECWDTPSDMKFTSERKKSKERQED